MAAIMTLDFYQIYYKDEQLTDCYSFATPYKNENITDYFENKVISELVPRSTAHYISVCSWRLKAKRKDGYTPIVLRNDLELSEEKILSKEFDIAVLGPRSSTHKMMVSSALWHGGPMHDFAWENAIAELKKFMPIPEEVTTPIYENHFIARKEIYHDYVSNCLDPVMQYMAGKDVFFADSGYARKKERTQPGEVKRYQELTGRKDWPIAPFILERLLSIWINDKQFKIINL
jgi:hypothetical protein